MSSWIRSAMKIVASLAESQADAIEQAAQIAARSIAADGVVYAFGTGHSRVAVEELFPRYGSYPGYQPMVELSMTFHTQVVGSNGQRQAMRIERTEGLAAEILASYELRQIDSMFIFSVSGVNAVPLEMAVAARAAGLSVVAFTSIQDTMAVSPRHPSGTRLCDHADVVIDIGSPVGDALCAVPGVVARIGPVSTFSSVALVNELKVRVAELLVEMGAMPPVLSAEQAVGSEQSKRSFDLAYMDYARRLSTILKKAE